jgi:hypothetical protein
MGDAHLGHGVRMNGRRHSHDHCLHYGGCYCHCSVVSSGVDDVCSRVNKISFIMGNWSSHIHMN